MGVGNVTPSAEFNLWFDPEAASIVFQCGRPITMVPLEVTHQALATNEIVSSLRAAHRPVASFVADLLVFFAESYKNVFGFSAPPVHDPCAVAAVLEPAIIHAADMYVEIETTSVLSAGRTVCDVYGKLGKPANVRVGYGLDVARFWDVVIDTILSY